MDCLQLSVACLAEEVPETQARAFTGHISLKAGKRDRSGREPIGGEERVLSDKICQRGRKIDPGTGEEKEGLSGDVRVRNENIQGM